VLQRRDYIAENTGIPRTSLPFVGELIQVHKDHERWTGAIERLLRNFALTILVHPDNYQQVDAFVNITNMRGRIEYFPVPAAVTLPPTKPSPNTVAGKIEIKPDAGAFGRYIIRELFHRFDHLCCDTTNRQWHDADQALTITGLFKGRSGRRIKDDGRDINDRRNWVLGWNNQAKLALLIERRKHIEEAGRKAAGSYEAAQKQKQVHAARLAAARQLIADAFTFDQINTLAVAVQMKGKQARRDTLKQDPTLEKLSREIATAQKSLKETGRQYDQAVAAVAVKEAEEMRNLERTQQLTEITSRETPELENAFLLIRKRLDLPVQRLDDVDSRRRGLFQEYSDEITAVQKIETDKTYAALAKMAEIILHDGWQHLHDELGSAPPAELTPAAVERFQRVETRICKDDSRNCSVGSASSFTAIETAWLPASTSERSSAFLRAAGCDSGPFPSSDATHGS